MTKRHFLRRISSLENLTFIGALAGLAFGLLAPELSLSLSVLGDLFLIFLKSMILPVILISVFLAVANAAEGLAQLGLKTLLYFAMTSALACITGLMAANFILEAPETALSFQNFDPSQVKSLGARDFILSFFAGNPFRALADGQILPLVIFTLVIGVATTHVLPEKRQILTRGADAAHDVIMTVMNWILRLAPIGVLSLVATVVAQSRDLDLSQLKNFFLAVGAAALIHSLFTLPAIAYFIGRFSPYRFMIRIREALLVALATASSSATLPVSTRVLEKEGVSPRVTGFVLPLGATLNMNGSALYQALVVLFLGHVAGVDFSLSQQVVVFLLVMLSAAGTAGIPGGGLMMMTATLQTLGLPLELIGLYLLVDRFWDPPITMINVMDDLFAAKTIERWGTRRG